MSQNTYLNIGVRCIGWCWLLNLQDAIRWAQMVIANNVRCFAMSLGVDWAPISCLPPWTASSHHWLRRQQSASSDENFTKALSWLIIRLRAPRFRISLVSCRFLQQPAIIHSIQMLLQFSGKPGRTIIGLVSVPKPTRYFDTLSSVPPVAFLVWPLQTKSDFLSWLVGTRQGLLLYDHIITLDKEACCLNFRFGRNYIPNNQVEWIWTFVEHFVLPELCPDFILKAQMAASKNHFHVQSLCHHIAVYVCRVSNTCPHPHLTNILNNRLNCIRKYCIVSSVCNGHLRMFIADIIFPLPLPVGVANL